MEASLIPRLSFLLPCTRLWEWRLASFPDSLSSSPAQDSGNGGKPYSQTPPLHKSLGMRLREGKLGTYLSLIPISVH